MTEQNDYKSTDFSSMQFVLEEVNESSSAAAVPSVPAVLKEVSESATNCADPETNLFTKVISQRILPQNALPLCIQVLGVPKSSQTQASTLAIINAWYLPFRSAGRYDRRDDGSDSDSDNDYGYNGNYCTQSFMAKKFHPAPDADSLWAPSMRRDAEWLKTKCEMICSFPASATTPSEADQLLEFLEEAKTLIGATGIEGYILTSNKQEEIRVASAKAQRPKSKSNCRPSYGRDSAVPKPRKTCRAQFILKPHAELIESGSGTDDHSLAYHPDYVRALKFVSTLQGRVHTWYEPWITANSLRLAKTGLTTFHANEVAIELAGSEEEFQKQYPITTVTLAMMVSEWGARKQYTLESQKQGALNEHLAQLLELAKVTEPGALKMIALIYPLPEIYAMIPKEACFDIYQKWMSWAKHLGRFMDEQWNKGVWKSARREMRVLPKGSPVNSTGFNATADAWSNMCRYVRVAVSTGEIKGAPLFLKSLQLIANDQFKMGQACGKGVHADVAVFDSLTRTSRSADGVLVEGILPWTAVIEPSKFDTMSVLTRLSKACADNNVELDTWLGLPKVRTEEVKTHVDMICGCAVPSMSTEASDWLKSLGIFGAREWDGK